MGMSGVYGPADRAESIATIRAALDAGITLLDTGDFYGMGHSELLLADALRGVRRDSVFIQVKFGAQRDRGGGFPGYDASPAAVKTAPAYSLQRLGTNCIDRGLRLFQVDEADFDHPPRVARVEVDQVDHAHHHPPGDAQSHVRHRRGERRHEGEGLDARGGQPRRNERGDAEQRNDQCNSGFHRVRRRAK
jgi:Aldo/keto reductase family